jgi:hypothetical protein
VISDQNKAVRIAEWERTQEDTFDQRKDGRGRPNPEGQREYDREGKTGRFPQLPQCEAEMLSECVHASSVELFVPA